MSTTNTPAENPFTFKPATRQGIKPLISLYAESGCGKTMSALLLARGFVGPKGKLAMIDTEAGRGSLYADVIQGGYDVMQITEPFTPARYVQAIQAAEQSGATIGILDSGSHSWEGIGGVLDMAGEIEEKSGKTGLHCWRVPKMEHAKFVLKLVQSSIPWIICLRAKYKSRQVKGTQEMADNGAIMRNQVGKTVILKDDATSPIQAEDFLFEMTAHAEILPDHSIRLTKCSHPDLRKCFPEKGPITIEHGRLIAAWCAAPSGPGTANQPATPAMSGSPDMKALKAELWKLTKSVHKSAGAADAQDAMKRLDQWLIDEAVISDTETLAEMGTARLAQVIELCRAKLSTTQPQQQP